ncbi:hypothetical protein TNCV_3854441 [Trichonephila clavipes]|nr:hypothetical protein TNCV_3854441 [Trichonephila clavipes]
MPVHFSPSSNRKEDELFPSSSLNKPHLSPTSQRKPGCHLIKDSYLSQAPLTSMTPDGGSLREPYAQRQPIAGYPRVIPEPEVTRRLAKHRYSQLRIAPNPRIIHPKITRGLYPPISEGNSRICKQIWTTASIFFLLEDLETLESIERRPVFIP